MALRTLLLGSKLKAAVTALVVVGASVGGAFAFGVVGAPKVVDVENRFGDVNETTTTILTDLVVHNPNPIGVRLGDSNVTYSVKMNDVRMATGSKEGIEIDPGNTTLNFTTQMYNDRIPPWWVSHIENGETTNVTVDATVQTSIAGGNEFEVTSNRRVQTNIIGQFNSDETRPVYGPESPIYDNPVLYINETRGAWGDVTKQQTPINMQFRVYNPQTKPYTITKVGYNITMNGIKMGEGETDNTYVIEGGTRETIKTSPTIQNARLDDWWVSHLRHDQVTNLRIDFYAVVELPTGNSVTVPLDRLTYEKRIETDLFGNKNESVAGNQQTPTSSNGDSAGTATPTPTDTPTASPLPETPTTSDGVLGVLAVRPVAHSA